MGQLHGKRIAILIENNYQELEVWYPLFRFQEAGAKVRLVGGGADRYLSKLGYPANADLPATRARARDFDALVVPGGYAPDLMRLNPAMVKLVGDMAKAGKVTAAICHGTWLLASANVIKGKKVTGAPSIKDDLRNAGAIFKDAEVVHDGPIVTSRKPADLPAFCAAIIDAMTRPAKSTR